MKDKVTPRFMNGKILMFAKNIFDKFCVWHDSRFALPFLYKMLLVPDFNRHKWCVFRGFFFYCKVSCSIREDKAREFLKL